MPVELIIQEMMVENGKGEKIIPIYHTNVHVPKADFEDEVKNQRAHTLMESASTRGTESSFVQNFPITSYGQICFYSKSD